MLKPILIFIVVQVLLADAITQKSKLEELAKKLYEVEDKVDHLLFHFSHDVTKHEYQATPFGTFLAPVPKNPNSIHQKLKLIDYLNHQMGHPNTMNIAANNALNMGLGVPGVPTRDMGMSAMTGMPPLM